MLKIIENKSNLNSAGSVKFRQEACRRSILVQFPDFQNIQHRVQYFEPKYYFLSFPNIVFNLTYSSFKINDGLNVVHVPINLYMAFEIDDKLFIPPLLNVYDDCKVCLGSTSGVRNMKFLKIDEMINFATTSFWSSRFNYSLHDTFDHYYRYPIAGQPEPINRQISDYDWWANQSKNPDWRPTEKDLIDLSSWVKNHYFKF